MPVILAKGHWIRMLQALQRYGETHGDANWRTWRMQIRREIMGAINPHREMNTLVAVSLSMDDWRTIWQQVHTACRDLGEDWPSWFGWLNRTMTKQIKSSQS